ncbi:unnamed protein product [Caenorhabditis bovis]|uniref:Major sperm protein n=1 Tax=Caenorhabditis bovis TaxID=2654633 RepID=A0A8S1EMT5_9PELO|nr:unnamed protein product [Caenorhabditis bovis]
MKAESVDSEAVAVDSVELIFIEMPRQQSPPSGQKKASIRVAPKATRGPSPDTIKNTPAISKSNVESVKTRSDEVKLAEKMGAVKIGREEVRQLVGVPKEYPDSDPEDAKSPPPLMYGTISKRQAERLEQLYRTYDKFPTGKVVAEFIDKNGVSPMDVELWLETRRELTYRKWQKLGLDTQASVMKFYSEALKVSEGIRLEQPSIRMKSFFSHEGEKQVEAKKEEEEKMIPSLTVTPSKIFVSPDREEKFVLAVKNTGEVNVVYQISMVNSENYLMSPICAILHPHEELSLNITRKVGPIVEELFRLDYGAAPDGIIDAREAANRSEMTKREIIEVVTIDNNDMKVVR